MSNKRSFYSNGKLLITGEYLVLNGAHALALPTKFGQLLHISPLEQQTIIWQSFDQDGSCWFETQLAFTDIKQKINFEEDPIKQTLIHILHYAFKQNPTFLENQGYTIQTELTFPRNWGLGTSSTLINNIAQWLQIDAFQLLRESFGGSGYDIACAQNDTAILYQLENELPHVQIVSFDPKYKEQLYFVYLNQKQNSRHAIQHYMNKQAFLQKETEKINAITQDLLVSNEMVHAAQLLEKHEIILSTILELPTVKERLFPDFKGTIKSLGAWGGDFVLVVSEENPTSYFKNKGYETILKYEEMIL